MSHSTNLEGAGQELFNALDDLLAYLHEKANEGTSLPHENRTLIKAREAIRKYAVKEVA